MMKVGAKFWPTEKLADVAQVQTGLAKNNERALVHPVELPYLRVANVQDGHLDLSEVKTVAVEAERIERYSLKYGDVLVTEGGDFDKLGRGTVWREQVSPCLHQNHVFAVRVDRKKLLPEFLAAYCAAEPGRHYFLSCSKQTTNLASINSSQLKDLPIKLPPLNEQRRIVVVLANCDRRLETAQKLLDLRACQREQTIRELYELSDQKGKKMAVGGFLTESRDEGGHGGSAEKLTVKLYGKGVVAKTERLKGSEKTRYYKRTAGQLIFSKLDFLNGAIGIVPEHLDGMESTLDLPAFDIDAKINPRWLLGYLTRPEYYSRRVDIARGQRIARRVQPEDLLATSIRVPPGDVQDKIAKALKASEKHVELMEWLFNSIRSQKRGLMQKLLTGQWRLTRDLPGMEATDG